MKPSRMFLLFLVVWLRGCDNSQLSFKKKLMLLFIKAMFEHWAKSKYSLSDKNRRIIRYIFGKARCILLSLECWQKPIYFSGNHQIYYIYEIHLH